MPLKTYDVTCPDQPFCGEAFEVELDPAIEEDCIECPYCGQEFDWEHDAATDIITLLPDEENEENEDDEDDDGDDDEEEDQLP